MSDGSKQLPSPVQERIMAGGIFLVSLYLIYISMDFPFESRVFPVAVLSLMAILSGSLVVQSFIKSSTAAQGETASEYRPFFIHKPRFAGAFASIFGYIFLLPKLGYFTTSTLFFIVLTQLLGYRNYKNLFLTIFVFLGFVYLVFIVLFERPIPPEFFQAG